jgi:predicted phosphoribosyltransferase
MVGTGQTGRHGRGGEVSLVYRDRAQAGEVLARRLADFSGLSGREDLTILALPRGGVPVAYPIATRLAAPLDILAVRKLGVPGHEELAMGAIATGGVRVLNREVLGALSIGDDALQAVTRSELGRLADQERRFRGGRSPAPVMGRIVILVDDGLATGASMDAAIVAARQAGAEGIVVAVPVGSVETVARLRPRVDRVVCPSTPVRFRAVGLAYGDFAPVADREVIDLLAAAGVERK